nr:hypothetical protein CFP56_34878 [Quercus suber]
MDTRRGLPSQASQTMHSEDQFAEREVIFKPRSSSHVAHQDSCFRSWKSNVCMKHLKFVDAVNHDSHHDSTPLAIGGRVTANLLDLCAAFPLSAVLFPAGLRPTLLASKDGNPVLTMAYQSAGRYRYSIRVAFTSKQLSRQRSGLNR